MEFKIKIKENNPQIQIVEIQGDIDPLTYQDFYDWILNELGNEPRHLLLDLTRVSYLSSSGVGVLFLLKKNLESKGKSFGLLNAAEKVLRVLEIVRAEDILIRPEALAEDHPFYSYARKHGKK